MNSHNNPSDKRGRLYPLSLSALNLDGEPAAVC
jgi:hypothetical protein